LENFAEELGVSTTKMISDFNATMPTFAMFGSNAERVFRETAAAAKSSGIEISKFTQLMDLTDTFEGSTESAQKLNALLGGPFVDSMALLNAETPTEKMRILQQSIRDAGVSAESFEGNRFLSKAFADAIPGIDNSAELLRLLNGDLDSLQETTGAAGKNIGELTDKLGTVITPAEALERAQMLAFAMDGVGQYISNMNDQLFPSMIDNIESVSTKTSETLKPAFDEIKGYATEMAEAVGLTVENLDKIRAEGVAGITERARAQGPETINIQLMLDGEVIGKTSVKAVEAKLSGRL